MNERLTNNVDAEEADGSRDQIETTIVQFDKSSELDVHEATIKEPAVTVGNKRLKIHEPGEDWL